MKQYAMLLITLVGGSVVRGQQGQWDQHIDFPGSPRNATATFSVGNNLYIVAGADSTGVLDEVWKYRSVQNTWVQLDPFPGGARYLAAGFSIGSKGYVICGTSSGQDPLGAKNDLWGFDPATGVWDSLAPMDGAPRSGAVAFVIADKAYVGSGTITTPTDTAGNVADFHVYDPAANTWGTIAPIPSARRLASAFAIGGKGYVGMGTTNYADTAQDLHDLWSYDPIANEWDTCTPMPAAGRFSSSAFSLCDLGYVGAGTDGPGYPADLWAYDPGIDNWTEIIATGTDTIVQRSSACSAVINGLAYLGLGYNTYLVNDLWSFGRSSEASQLTAMADPVVSCGTTGLALDGTDTLWAVEVECANKYQFNIVNNGGPAYSRNIASPTRALRLAHWASKPMKPGRSYAIRVRTSTDNGMSWSAFGPTCTIATSYMAPPLERLVDDGAQGPILWPNPSMDGALYLSFPPGGPASGAAEVEVFDPSGLRVMHCTVPMIRGEAQLFGVNAKLPSGLYLVRILLGEHAYAHRVAIQR